MAFPGARRAVLVATLAGGTPLGGGIGVGHALAATKTAATPSPRSSTSTPSTTHHCPRDANGASSSSTA